MCILECVCEGSDVKYEESYCATRGERLVHRYRDRDTYTGSETKTEGEGEREATNEGARER